MNKLQFRINELNRWTVGADGEVFYEDSQSSTRATMNPYKQAYRSSVIYYMLRLFFLKLLKGSATNIKSLFTNHKIANSFSFFANRIFGSTSLARKYVWPKTYFH